MGPRILDSRARIKGYPDRDLIEDNWYDKYDMWIHISGGEDEVYFNTRINNGLKRIKDHWHLHDVSLRCLELFRDCPEHINIIFSEKRKKQACN